MWGDRQHGPTTSRMELEEPGKAGNVFLSPSKMTPLADPTFYVDRADLGPLTLGPRTL